jgi:hypothetical protein
MQSPPLPLTPDRQSIEGLRRSIEGDRPSSGLGKVEVEGLEKAAPPPVPKKTDKEEEAEEAGGQESSAQVEIVSPMPVRLPKDVPSLVPEPETSPVERPAGEEAKEVKVGEEAGLIARTDPVTGAVDFVELSKPEKEDGLAEAEGDR